MRDQGAFVKLSELGDGSRPVIKAGPFGSSITKAMYQSTGYKVYGQEQVVAGDARVGDYYVSRNHFDKLSTCDVRSGDVLISVMGTVGRALVVPDDHEPGIINPRLLRIAVDRQRVNPNYIRLLFESASIQRVISQRTQGGTMGGLNAAIVGDLRVFLPDRREQEDIIALLDHWGRAIAIIERLILAKLKLRKSLMQQLLTGKRRFPGLSDPWREVALGEVTTESSRRNNGELDRTTVRAVTNSAGMIPMREQTIAESLDRYKIIAPRAFAYNPMRINVGSLCMWTGDSPALVSPDYVVFACNEGQLDATYFDYLRQTHRWAHYMTAGGNGSVRIRIYYADLAGLRFVIPPYTEQVRIGRFLGSMDRELELLRAQLAALKAQKKGLMQQLLTGKVRVPLPLPEDQAAEVAA